MFATFQKLASRLPKHTFTRQFSTNPNHKEYIFPNRERINVFASNDVGVLSRILNAFHYNQVTLTNVTTTVLNKMRDGTQGALFTLDFEGKVSDPKLQKILKELNLFSQASIDEAVPEVPWFPAQMQELDHMGIILQKPTDEEGKDHPGFKDQEYKRRRDEIAQSSLNVKYGKGIPNLKYTDVENKTWETIYKKLRPLQEKYMCDSFNKSFEKMREAGIYKPNEIPQLNDVNEFLKKETNFNIKPVTGILSQREFLNALALRTFCCTQYIRHHSMPEYTPEPDIIHELLGHVAMFADPDFCALSQEIGLLSLGNTAENIKKLGGLYWYTVEFGVCKEDGGVKAYGAGIASSIKEILNFGENKAKFRKLDPFNDLDLNFPIQTVQPVYLVAESFKDAGNMLIRYGEYLPKPFKASYNFMENRIEADRKIKLVDVDEKPVEFNLT